MTTAPYVHMYNLAKNIKFLVRSIFSSSANFGPLMTNDGALESLHQGEIVFVHLAGGRYDYKKMFWEQTNSRQAQQNARHAVHEIEAVKDKVKKKQNFPRKRKAFEW